MIPFRPFQSFRALGASTALLLSIVACEKGADPDARSAASAAPPPRDPNTPLYVTTTGLKTPESVQWDASRNVWYVSNINGSPAAKDDNGFIMRLGRNGQLLDSLPFINGADRDITLHAPKGLFLQGDTLWVADIDVLRGFDVGTGAVVATVGLARLGARFLNDVAVGTEGEIYISDTGIRFANDGSVTHPSPSRIFVVRNRTASQAVVLPRQSGANGIMWDRARNSLVIVGFNSPNVFSWVRGARETTVLGTGPGGADGLVLLGDGRMVYTSWADSSLTLFSSGESSTLRKGLNGPADLGYDPARKLIAVPLFMDNRVEFWPLESPPAPPTGR